MADMNYLPYAQQNAEIERQRRLAELLQQQAYQPMETQIVGGRAIPISPWQTAAKLMQAGLGAYMQSKSDKAAAKLDEEQRKEAKEQIENYFKGFGPQKVTTQTPVMEQDFGQAATPEDYQNMMNDPSLGLAPKRRDVSQAATPEDMQDIVNQPYEMKDVTSYTPGMSRTQALAKLLEMKTGGNKYLSDATSVLAGALPKEVDTSELFNKLDLSKLTPESAELVAATGDPTKARFIEDKITPYQKAELAMREQDNKVRAAEAEVQNARSEAQLKIAQANLNLAIQGREQQKAEFAINYPGASAQGGQAAGRPLDKVSYNAFKEQDAKIDEASGNFTNFRSVLGSISPTQGIVGKQAGELATAFKAAQASIRLLQNTGVLNQGELPFLEETLANPQGFMAIANPTTRAKLEGQLNELDKLVKRKKAALYKQYEQPLPSSLQTTSSSQSTATGSFAGVPAGFESYYENTP